MSDCIFVCKPPECINCMDSLKIQCLMNHPSHAVSGEQKADLRKLLDGEMNNKNRTRTTQRKE